MKYVVFGLLWFFGGLVCALALGKVIGHSPNDDGFIDESQPYTVLSSSDDVFESVPTS